MGDIIDDIDALVDEQLAGGESAAQQRAEMAERRCPHCGRGWHGLAITQRLERMRIEHQQREERRRIMAWIGEGVGEADYAESAILDGYRYDEDDSPVICPGSDFIGPPQPPPECECPMCTRWRCLVGGVASGDAFVRAIPVGAELDLGQWVDVGRIGEGGFSPQLVEDPQPLRSGGRRGVGPAEFTVTVPTPAEALAAVLELASGNGSYAISGPSRAERRHPTPEDRDDSAEVEPTSLRDLRRRRSSRQQPQQPPVWAARMDGRRG